MVYCIMLIVRDFLRLGMGVRGEGGGEFEFLIGDVCCLRLCFLELIKGSKYDICDMVV